MATTLSTATRTAMAQAIINYAGASARFKLMSGAKPANLGAPAGQVLATLVGGASLGTASAGAIDFDEAGFTQTPAGFLAGSPTYVRLETAGGVVVADIDVGAGGFQFSGAVVVGQSISLTNLSIAIGNA